MWNIKWFIIFINTWYFDHVSLQYILEEISHTYVNGCNKNEKCKFCDIEFNETNRARNYLRCVKWHSNKENERYKLYSKLN